MSWQDIFDVIVLGVLGGGVLGTIIMGAIYLIGAALDAPRENLRRIMGWPYRTVMVVLAVVVMYLLYLEASGGAP